MKKNLTFLISSFAIICLLWPFGFWFTFILGPFLMSFFIKISIKNSMLLGSLSTLLFWTFLLFYHSFGSSTDILSRISLLFKLGQNPYFLIIIILSLASILGLLAGLCGSLWRKAFFNA